MEKNEKNKTSTLMISIISIIVILSIIVVVILLNREDEADILSIEELQELKSIDRTIKENYQPDRSTYGYGTYTGKKFLIVDSFKRLPPLPEDFYKYKFALMEGKATLDMVCNISSDYYLQPEFYSDRWDDLGLDKYKNPDPNHWAPEGYGTFPHEVEIIANPGDEFNICTFFHTSFTVQTYQGFKLNNVYPGSSTFDSITHTINSSDSRKYLTYDIYQRNVLLEPTYVLFEPAWSHKVVSRLKISEDTPPGMYAVGYDVGRGDTDHITQWALDHQELYRDKSGLGISANQFVITVKVNG